MQTTTPKSGKEILRFAHPFFTDVPVDKRNNVAGVGKRMRDYIPQKLEKIPADSQIKFYYFSPLRL